MTRTTRLSAALLLVFACSLETQELGPGDHVHDDLLPISGGTVEGSLTVDGPLGAGVAEPTDPVEVQAAATGRAVTLVGTASDSRSTLAFASSDRTSEMLLQSDGEGLSILGGAFGIGRQSPVYLLHVSGSTDLVDIEAAAGSAYAGVLFHDAATNRIGGVRAHTNSSPTATLRGDFELWAEGDGALYISNTNVGIGTEDPAAALDVVGNIAATGSITPGSSRTLKQDIRDLGADDALAALIELRPTRFRYKADPSEEHVGFIAEEVPALVATRDRRGVDPTDIVATLAKVVQLQQQRLEAQERRIAELERRLARSPSRQHR